MLTTNWTPSMVQQQQQQQQHHQQMQQLSRPSQGGQQQQQQPQPLQMQMQGFPQMQHSPQLSPPGKTLHDASGSQLQGCTPGQSLQSCQTSTQQQPQMCMPQQQQFPQMSLRQLQQQQLQMQQFQQQQQRQMQQMQGANKHMMMQQQYCMGSYADASGMGLADDMCPAVPLMSVSQGRQRRRSGLTMCSSVKPPALSNTLFTALQNELQDYVVDEKEINMFTDSDHNDGRLRERQETKYSNLLCSLVYFTATDRDGTVHAARGAQVLKRALNSNKLRHFVKNIVPKVDKVQAATKLFDNMKSVLHKISKNTTNAARQLRTTMLACIVSCDLDNKEKKMLSRCLLDDNATKMQKARIHKQLKEASKRRAEFFGGQREFIWESSRAKRKDALSDEVIASIQDAILTLTAGPAPAKRTKVAATACTATKASAATTPDASDEEDREPRTSLSSEGATSDDSESKAPDTRIGVQNCTDTELHKKVLAYLNAKMRESGDASQKEFTLSVDRFRIIKRAMGNIKRYGAKTGSKKRKAGPAPLY